MTTSPWFWVVLGYGVAYGSMAGYHLALRLRTARVRRMVEVTP